MPPSSAFAMTEVVAPFCVGADADRGTNAAVGELRGHSAAREPFRVAPLPES